MKPEQNNYQKKLMAVGLDCDPYELPKDQWCMDIEMWAGIGFPDSRFTFLPGKYTKQSLKAFKSLDAWSYFKAGFVCEFRVMTAPLALPLSVIACVNDTFIPSIVHFLSSSISLLVCPPPPFSLVLVDGL